MLADLHSDRAVPRAIRELNAILEVNSSKLSSAQYLNLTQARDKLRGMERNLAEFTRDQSKPGYDKDRSWTEYGDLFKEAKGLIRDAAATF